ncbi:hypothetical protein OIO90_005271 [Microbotryomycetes sp. JL221]|nr:hypothetical protein OIO90_005271 [Microbotryomycetes sp. JL221]
MFGKPANPYEEVVAKATDEKQTEVSWDILLTVWDKVNEDGEAGARNCVAALQKRLQHRSANVQLFSLTLAGALVNNCGPPLHREISGRAFTQTLARLVNDRTTHDSVKKEALKMIEDWVKEHPNNSDFDLMAETYDSLKRQNHRFSSDRVKTPPPNPRSEELMRREEEELQRALAESAAMADPRRGFVPSQPPQDKALPRQPNGASSDGTDTLNRSPPKTVRAVYDFAGQGQDELGFARGDVIRVIEFADANWWRGELRGRMGIFPANRVEEVPEPTPSAESNRNGQQSLDDVEAELFAKAASIDKLLVMMRNLSARGEDLTDNDELADRYNECMSMAPKVVALIRKYDQKQAELREMHEKFTRAKTTYERMSGYAAGPGQGPTQASYVRPQSYGYSNGYPQQQPPPHVQPGPNVSYGAQYPQGARDPERERREFEEQQRREYEQKWAQYQRDLAEYEAAQARLAGQQQQAAQQRPPQAQQGPPQAQQQTGPPPLQGPGQPYPQPQQPPVAIHQQHSGPPPAHLQPTWDGQQWIYPAQSNQPPPGPGPQPTSAVAAPPQDALPPSVVSQHPSMSSPPMASPAIQHITPTSPAPQPIAQALPPLAASASAPNQYPVQPYPETGARTADLPDLTRSVSQLSVSSSSGPGAPGASFATAQQQQSLALSSIASSAQAPAGISSGPNSTVLAHQPSQGLVNSVVQSPQQQPQQILTQGPPQTQVPQGQQQQQGYVYASEEEREAAAKAWEEYYEKKRVYDEWVASQGGAVPPAA